MKNFNQINHSHPKCIEITRYKKPKQQASNHNDLWQQPKFEKKKKTETKKSFLPITYFKAMCWELN